MRLMVVDGPVPFSQLFPKVDVAILHGGLGVCGLSEIRVGRKTKRAPLISLQSACTC